MIWYDVLWYDIWYDMIWYDMIWYDMIWYDMIWYDMIWYDDMMIWWYDMIWYDMIWYDMIWYDMIWYDIWYDTIRYDMIWYDMIYDMIYDIYDMIWYGMMWCAVIWYDMIWLVTPCRVLLEKLTSSQLVKKSPAFYGTRRFITTFTSARHLSISWASSIQSIPPTSHFLKIHLNIIIPSTPGLPSGLFPSSFPTKTLYAPLLLVGRTEVSVQIRGFLCENFLTWYVFTARSCQHLAQPQVGGPPFVGCPRVLIQYIRGYPPYRGAVLHPQPEVAPCRGDRDPLTTDIR